MYRGKSDKIKESKEAKKKKKINKYFEDINKEIPNPMESEGKKNLTMQIYWGKFGMKVFPCTYHMINNWHER